jgi:hypothetical protein
MKPPTTTKRRCTTCGKTKSAEKFVAGRNQCRDCYRAYHQAYERTDKCKAYRRRCRHTQRYGPNRLRTHAKDAEYNARKFVKRWEKEHSEGSEGQDVPTQTLAEFIAWCQQL